MTTQQISSGVLAARDYLNFVCDASGWSSLDESDWHICAHGKVGGRGVTAAALLGTQSAVSAGALYALTDAVGRHDGQPLILVLTPCQTSSDLVLNRLLSDLVRARKNSPIIAVVLGELIGPVAIMARLADIICFGPTGSLALADTHTSRRVTSPNSVSVPAGKLSRRFPTDAAALMGARRIASMLPAEAPVSRSPRNPAHGENLAIERLVGPDRDKRIDERRLLQRISDDGSFLEFDGSGGLTTGLTRIGFETVGVLANNASLSGALDAAALAQAASLARLCGRLSLPVMALIDSPGVVPDDTALGALAVLVTSWEESNGSVISLILREAIGAAPAALIPHGARVLYWPGAKAGLSRDRAGPPQGQMISVTETRQALIRALASRKEIAT